MSHLAVAMFRLPSGATADDPSHPQHPKPQLWILELSIATIINVVIITISLTATLY